MTQTQVSHAVAHDQGPKHAALIFQTLRVGAALCFIGHGVFGFITKEDWVPFFAIVGIPETIAFRLMPLIGLMDVALGFLVLVRPMAAPLFYMTAWAVWTALCRPLSGLNVWEVPERAGNYGVSLALIVAAGWFAKRRGFFHSLTPDMTAASSMILERLLRVTTALLLVGHGGFGAFVKKPMLMAHWAAAGIPITESTLVLQGWFEIALGVGALFVPSAWYFLGLCIWKMATELLYPISGAPVWEFIERAGSYMGPLALFFLIRFRKRAAQGS